VEQVLPDLRTGYNSEHLVLSGIGRKWEIRNGVEKTPSSNPREIQKVAFLLQIIRTDFVPITGIVIINTWCSQFEM
jgi:hypothetical protein